MTARKARLTVTVDQALVRAGAAAVASGHADSLSGWVNIALAERAAKELQLRALAEAIATYEAKAGRITTRELAEQERTDRGAAIVVRGQRSGRSRSSKRSGAA